MTRDEALKIFRLKAPGCPPPMAVQNWIDVFIALGMLQVEEPKSAYEKFNFIVRDWIDPVEHAGFFTDMDRAGLKVVEK